jgi:hypothetical protein
MKELHLLTLFATDVGDGIAAKDVERAPLTAGRDRLNRSAARLNPPASSTIRHTRISLRSHVNFRPVRTLPCQMITSKTASASKPAFDDIQAIGMGIPRQHHVALMAHAELPGDADRCSVARIDACDDAHLSGVAKRLREHRTCSLRGVAVAPTEAGEPIAELDFIAALQIGDLCQAAVTDGSVRAANDNGPRRMARAIARTAARDPRLNSGA